MLSFPLLIRKILAALELGLVCMALMLVYQSLNTSPATAQTAPDTFDMLIQTAADELQQAQEKREDYSYSLVSKTPVFGFNEISIGLDSPLYLYHIGEDYLGFGLQAAQPPRGELIPLRSIQVLISYSPVD